VRRQEIYGGGSTHPNVGGRKAPVKAQPCGTSQQNSILVDNRAGNPTSKRVAIQACLHTPVGETSMSALLIGLVVGIVVGWNWPQPKVVKNIQDKFLGFIGYKGKSES
jgi:UDP-N-acetylmuramyl pentapeptide synthase